MWPEIWSIWKEVDPRRDREVMVIAHDYRRRRVQIRGASRTLWACVSRFNGKRGGYAKVDRDAN